MSATPDSRAGPFFVPIVAPAPVTGVRCESNRSLIMPITLGCPSCGKRFRARDESVGKRVKCPFCQAAVPVPSPEEAHNASAPTDVVPEPGSKPAMEPLPPDRASIPVNRPGPRSDVGPFPTRPGPVPPSAPIPVARADEWGATGGDAADREPTPVLLPSSLPEPRRPAVSGKPPEKPRSAKAARPAKTPPEMLAGSWAKASSGLAWVLFGLFWLALPGFFEFGKTVYERTQGPLPTGEGWVKIDGYVNTDGPNVIRLDKQDELKLLAYGVPALLGGLALTLGRLTAGAAPRNSGAKGLFGFSGVLTLVALATAATAWVSKEVDFKDLYKYTWLAFQFCLPLAEFWFLLALGAAGATLKRPKAVRAVGFYALVVGLAAVIYFAGWDLYVTQLGPEYGRPKKPEVTSDWAFYESGAKMLGWLIVIGTYWRAVGSVRGAAKEFVRNVADGRGEKND